MTTHVPLTGIYAIVDRSSTTDPLALLAAILAGGARVIQYRAKAGVDRELVRSMHERTRASGAVLVVNDDFEASLEADGWHAGQEDLADRDVTALRMRLGPRLFGISCGTPAEARLAVRMGADYVGTGPFSETRTKSDAGAPLGVAGLAAVVAAISIPVVAIGGIDLTNLAAVRSSGARMAAIVSAIATAPDPEVRTRELIAAWDAS